jgi:hypothetical protein
MVAGGGLARACGFMEPLLSVMASKSTIVRRLMTFAMIAGGGLSVALPLGLSLSTPAGAQFPFFNEQPPQQPRRPGQPAQPAPQPGFPFFSPFQAPVPEAPRAVPQVVIDYSKAPAPRKAETPPTTTIVVMGDSMADWLAYGLEDAVTDMPGIGIVRKQRANSGLVRYDGRSDLDWPHVARDILAVEKPGAVVMMLGLNDRQSIRDRAPARGATPPPAPTQEQQKQDPDSPEVQIIAPEPPRVGNGTYEFHTERWAEAYGRRIDETIAALKSKGVPVIWVGLPAVRGPKTTADNAYLNDLYRARAEKAGIIYVDVWDGFVDESGKFAAQGPDVEGQIRKLRAGDGVHFTKPGARKLAHYVEREIRRVMAIKAVPVALPTDEVTPTAPSATLRPGIPATRPLAGAVVPLTATAVSNSEELLGGSGGARPVAADPTVTRVLIKGDALAAPKGRADDFVWPPRSGGVVSQAPAEPESSQEAAVPETAQPLDAIGVKPGQERDAGRKNATAPAKPAGQSTQAVVVPASQQKPKPPVTVSRETPKPPASVGASAASPFSWFR